VTIPPTAPVADSELSLASPDGIEVHETHTGIVFLAGARAYKVKKPVLTDFLDFRAVEARERVCAHEGANKRLAPDSY
jgi:aminoglycoside phosphotransferase family enzyme